MIKKICLLIVGFFLLLSFSQASFASENKVVSIAIKGDIDFAKTALVKKAIDKANETNAKVLFVEIDTFGGYVDAAVKIRDMISESDLDTICYVKNRAWSAGALIAISHKHIAIAPGGSIGAAEPIPTTEKTVAALKAEFAATANKLGRDPKIAEAMVDKSLGYKQYAKEGQILALTDYQAIEVGYADMVAEDADKVLAHFGYQDAEIIICEEGVLESLSGILSDPTVKGILITIIFLAIMAEVKTAGSGIAIVIALIAAALFFSSHWLTGFLGNFEILLFIAGIGLVIAEFFLITSGILALIGVVCMFASIFLTLGGDQLAFITIFGSLAIALLIFLVIMKKLPNNRLLSKIILSDATTTEQGYVSSSDYEKYLGKEGITTTPLKPAGTVDIDGAYLDVVSESKFIAENKKVKVVSVEGNRIVVRLLEN
ncbi:nodulation protein NfeD [Selenomonadales bacterium OttesenSCG-928-I06]|nr:nodulation protein NfeD [Selenomonadales bacterium OttesenSCG-928-I06]